LWKYALDFSDYALDFSDVATPVHGHALHLKQQTRPAKPGCLQVSIEHAG
jgi:hypothetical protein